MRVFRELRGDFLAAAVLRRLKGCGAQHTSARRRVSDVEMFFFFSTSRDYYIERQRLIEGVQQAAAPVGARASTEYNTVKSRYLGFGGY